jgi:hypothetical protein
MFWTPIDVLYFYIKNIEQVGQKGKEQLMIGSVIFNILEMAHICQI